MIINYQKYPILGTLEQDVFDIKKCRIATFDIMEDKKNFLPIIINLIKGWPRFVKEVRNNITFLSDPYYQCMKRSWESFRRINLNEAIKPSSGVLIFNAEGRRTVSLIYIIKSMYDMRIYFLYDCDTLVFMVEGAYGNFRYVATSDDGVFEGAPKDVAILNTVNILIGFLLMERYAKVETITCAGKSKIRKENMLTRKTINYTGLPVKIRDCTWFTTICRSEGFKVRGHFRLQPKKNYKGEWIKELIYINEFEKHGYHRQAKILNDKSE